VLNSREGTGPVPASQPGANVSNRLWLVFLSTLDKYHDWYYATVMEYKKAELAAKNVSRNLARIMRAKSLTQSDLAKRAKVPPMTISRIVRGENVLTLGPLIHIASAVGVSIDTLIGNPRKFRRPS